VSLVRGPARLGGHLFRAGDRGQSLVEFALVVPLFLLLLLGMLEFGIAFTHDQTLTYATREGARTGAALADGNTAYPCTTANFDAPVIAAVQRVLESPGSLINVNNVTAVTIYLAKPDGTPTPGSVNTWALALGAGPTVDGKALDFKQTSTNWGPCSRNNGVNADGLGVSVTYNYPLQTSLGGIVKLMFGNTWSSMTMSDKTVMNLNPTAQ
jgi:Flp pilus assembly protein TadG